MISERRVLKLHPSVDELSSCNFLSDILFLVCVFSYRFI